MCHHNGATYWDIIFISFQSCEQYINKQSLPDNLSNATDDFTFISAASLWVVINRRNVLLLKISTSRVFIVLLDMQVWSCWQWKFTKYIHSSTILRYCSISIFFYFLVLWIWEGTTMEVQSNYSVTLLW